MTTATRNGVQLTNVLLPSLVESYLCKDSQSLSTEPTDGMRRKNVVMVAVGVTASCGGYIPLLSL